MTRSPSNTAFTPPPSRDATPPFSRQNVMSLDFIAPPSDVSRTNSRSTPNEVEAAAKLLVNIQTSPVRGYATPRNSPEIGTRHPYHHNQYSAPASFSQHQAPIQTTYTSTYAPAPTQAAPSPTTYDFPQTQYHSSHSNVYLHQSNQPREPRHEYGDDEAAFLLYLRHGDVPTLDWQTEVQLFSLQFPPGTPRHVGSKKLTSRYVQRTHTGLQSQYYRVRDKHGKKDDFNPKAAKLQALQDKRKYGFNVEKLLEQLRLKMSQRGLVLAASS